MRAARGNTVAAAAVNPEVRVGFWNGRALDMARTSAEARSKVAWLIGELEAQTPAVVFVGEVLGDMVAFRGLRRTLKRAGYRAVLLVGTDDNQRNGVLAAVNVKQGELRAHSKVADRTLGLKVLHRGEATESTYVYTHGLQQAGFRLQLKAAEAFCRASGGGLLCGDLNHVPCAMWRVVPQPLNRSDRALRRATGWTCDCCPRGHDDENTDATIVGGDGGITEEGTRAWTRYETTSRVWGAPTSRIDIAVDFGSGSSWELLPSSWPDVASEGEPSHAVSDHLMQWVARAAAVVGQARATRVRAPDLRRTADGRAMAEEIRSALSERRGLAWECERELARARRRGLPRADAAIDMFRTATNISLCARSRERRLRRASARGRRGGLGTPQCRLLTAKAELSEVASLRRRGVHASAADHSRIFHPSTGHRKYRLHTGDGWQLIIRRLRHRLRRAQQEIAARGTRDVSKLVDKAAAWAALPEHATAEKARLAYEMTSKPRAGAVLTHVRERDKKDGRRVSTMAHEAAELMAATGAANVRAADDGAVPAACAAWHDKFVGQWPELEGLAGGPWQLRDELSFPLFRRVMRKLQVKAAGVSGIALAQLRLASGRALRLLYDALVGDADEETISERWHKVVYVLLEKKPPNDPELIGERREIALTEQDTKLLLQCVRSACYARVIGRVRAQNLGWVPGYGCSDVGIASGWAAQQARQCGSTFYLLYADLAQFFPRVHRRCLRVAEVAHGIPTKVLALAAAIYGEHADDPRVARCVYDSAGGFSDTFPNGVGVLMGCPLSTDRARLFLNSIVCAIELTAKGMRLWGCKGGREEESWRRVAQLMCADDWCGVFEDERELRVAWQLWRAWEPLTGAKLGIKAADKTVLTGAAYDAQGRPVAVRNPRLTTVDGREVPLRPPNHPYKHLGRWRCADGSMAASRKEFTKAFHGALRRLKAMRNRATRYQFLLVSAALLGGAADHYLQDTFLTFKEADALEAKWRVVFNKHVGRARDSPRAELYAHEWIAGSTRRHIYSHGLVAIYSATCNAIADPADLDHRALARSGLALSLYKWGCRMDPMSWDWAHLEEPLLAELQHKQVRYLGDAWMFAVIQLRKAQVAAEGNEDAEESGTAAWDGPTWRWAAEPEEGEPLAFDATHFCQPQGDMVFESGAVSPCAELIHAGYVAVAHFCTGARGAWRFMGFAEAVSLNRELRETKEARDGWTETVAALVAIGATPVAPRRAVSVTAKWRADTRPPNPFEAAAPRPALAAQVNVRELAIVAEELQRARSFGRTSACAAYGAHVKAWRDRFSAHVHAWQGMLAARSTEQWRVRLDACTAVEGAPSEWCHGVPSDGDHAQGAHVVFELDRALEAVGGHARWLAGKDGEVDCDGYSVGWADRAAELTARFDIDEEGYLVDGELRVPLEDVDTLPVALQLLARSRYALGDVPVFERPSHLKDERTHVNLVTTREALVHLIRLQCQYRPTHLAAVDGTRATKIGASGEPYSVVARAAVLNTGEVISGTMQGSDGMLAEYATTYLAEKAATDDVLAALPDGSRVVLWLDSTSHVAALARFMRSVSRRKRQFHAAGRLRATEAQLRRHSVVVYHWQRSHTGEPQNEGADVAAAQAAESEEPLEVEEAVHDYCSILFPRDVKSPRHWAAVRADAMVADHLRALSVNTVYPSPNDLPASRRADPEDANYHSLRAERCFHSDAGLHLEPAQVARRAMATCPWGCQATCTWMHFCFECDGAEVVEHRRAWSDRLLELRALAEAGGVPHAQLGKACKWVGAGIGGIIRHGAGLPPGPACEWDRGHLRDARRTACGMFDSAGCSEALRGAGLKEAVAGARGAALALVSVAHRACRLEWGEQLRQGDLVARVMRRYVRALRERIFQGGPLRMRALRECDSLAARARAVGVDSVAAALVAIREKRATAHACVEWPGGRFSWWCLARLLRWRIRTWVRTRPKQACDTGAWRRSARRAVAHPCGAGEAWLQSMLAGDGGAAVTGEVETMQQLAGRAAMAFRLAAVPPRRRRQEAGGTARAAIAESAAHLSRWRHWAAHGGLNGDGVTSGPRLHVDCGGGRARRGTARRTAARRGYRIGIGAQADTNDAWIVTQVLDVRRRPGAGGGAIDAKLRWVSPCADQPWTDSWCPVNVASMPGTAGKRLRQEAWALWRQRHPPAGAQCVLGSAAARAPLDPASAAPSGSTRAAKRRYVRAEQDVDDEEENQIRRVEAPAGSEGAEEEEDSVEERSSDASVEDVDSEEMELSDGEGGDYGSGAGTEGVQAGRSDAGDDTASSMDIDGIGAGSADLRPEAEGGELGQLLARRAAKAVQTAAQVQGIHAAAAAELASGLQVDKELAARLIAGAGPAGGAAAGGSGGSAQCHYCALPVGSDLRDHASCIARALGWPDEHVPPTAWEAVRQLCRSPSIAGLERALCEVDVCGNGTCWLYAIAALHGLLQHVTGDDGRPARVERAEQRWHVGQAAQGWMDITQRDHVTDRALRVVVASWMQEHDWVRHQYGDGSLAMRPEGLERLANIRDRVPFYPEGYGFTGYRDRAWANGSGGEWGGDTEFIAVADVFGVCIAAYPNWMRNREPHAQRMHLSTPGPSRAGRGKGKGATVDEVLREALTRGVPLCVTVNVNGNHWHSLAPMDADGRVLARDPAGRGYPTDAVRKALSGEAWAAASAYVQAYSP